MQVYSSGTTRIRVDGAGNNSGVLLAESGVSQWSLASVGGAFQFYNEPNAVTRMFITSGGSVGIATTNPLANLQVGNGTQSAINGAGNKIHIATNGTRSALLTLANSSGGTTVEGQFESSAESADLRIIVGSSTNHPLVFRTNNTDRLRIMSAGNVLIGTTTDNGHKLRVFGDANITGRVGINTVTESGIQLVINGENNSTSAFALVVRNSSFSNLFRVRNDGSVIVSSLGTGTVYSSGGILTNTNPSDSKLKENILPINYGLNEILKLNAVTFNWKNDTINQGKQYGFIAQEVQKIMPDLVKQGEYLGLDKDAIFTTLVKAIQELKQEIDTLKN
jgi:hypothetical protein